ncbi:MAG: tRNA (guanine(37)-N1)-methyltransferase Trm5b [Candidatus Heimdallarchaeota archaeon LC_3]|nr:MAG: tRNA (guanine(37)-N1)-methyltransferase Trm5b [Candidatus Heimdallarchaeota archaeon LC_3]
MAIFFVRFSNLVFVTKVIFVFMNSNTFIDLLGIKCLKSDANITKIDLIANNLLFRTAKTILQDNYVIFPLIGDNPSTKIPESLQHLEINSYSFPVKQSKLSIEDQLIDNIPEDFHSSIPKSYDIIGKILLVKLEPELLPFKHNIADVYLNTLNIDSVFRKTDNVSSSYRTASWECIGGFDNPVTTHKMNNLDFMVNIKSVYFNSRLNNEYLIVSDQIQDKEVVWDLFCGIGPFSLTLAHKKDVIIYANDINSLAMTFLKQNIEINKKKLVGTIFPYNLDAQQAIVELPVSDCIFMNLPETAKDFLPGIFQRIFGNFKKKVTIYLYHFTHKEPSDREDLRKNIELQQLLESIRYQATNNDVKINSMNTRIIRDVSPNKTHFVTELNVSARNS